MELDLASAQYHLEYPAIEIVLHLRNAAYWAVELLKEFATSGRPHSNTPIFFLNDIGLVAAFGASGDRDWIAHSSPELFRHKRVDVFGRLQRVAEIYCAVLRGTAAVREIEDVRHACQEETASRFDAEWGYGIATSLLGLVRRDPTMGSDGLRSVVNAHEREAKRGDWKKLSEGLMSRAGLGLLRMFREAGIAVDVESPYVPVQLLEVR
jgi:hypothetical protein